MLHHLEAGSLDLDLKDVISYGIVGTVLGNATSAQGLSQVLSPETLQSRLYAYRRGQVSGTFLITSIAAAPGRRGVPSTSMVGCVGSATFQRRQAATALRFFEGSEDAAPSI